MCSVQVWAAPSWTTLTMCTSFPVTRSTAPCKAKRILSLQTPKRWLLSYCISTHKRQTHCFSPGYTENRQQRSILLGQTHSHLAQSREGGDGGDNNWHRESVHITQRTASQQLGWDEHRHLLSDPCGSGRAGRSSSPLLNHWRARLGATHSRLW